MKRVLLAMFVALLMITSGCKKEAKNVVITVNGTPVMQKEVDDMVQKQLDTPLFAQFDKKSDEAKLLTLITKDKVINELIVKKMLDNEIAKRGITVSKEDVEKYKLTVISDIGSEENLKQALKANGISDSEYNEMLLNQLKIAALIHSISPVKITDADVKKFYNANKASKFTHPDMVRASHILIADEAKAKEVLAKAKVQNADFAALATQYSEDKGSAPNGGDLGFFAKEQMVKPFADAAFSMKPDTVSNLVKSEFGYHIIKVTDRKKAGVTPFDDVKREIAKYLEEEQQVKVLQKFIDSQKSVTKIEYLNNDYNPETIKQEVKKYSQKNGQVAPQPNAIPMPKDNK